MLQTELTTNSTNNPAANSVNTKPEKQVNVAKRLEELTKWQEEQKKLLEARQTLQRKMLGMEHRNMYEMLGLENASEISIVEDIQKAIKEESLVVNDPEQLQEYEEESSDQSLETSQLDVEEVSEEERNYVEPTSHRTLTSVCNTEVCTDLGPEKPKKPFLKRGEGVKQRFKIDPNEFRLNNLPKYKYANAHPRLRLKPNILYKTNKDLKTQASNEPNLQTSNTKPTNRSLDAKEQRFQNLLITSKNACSSTPEVKPLKNSPRPTEEKTNNLSPKKHETQSDGLKTNPAVTNVVAWSKILDPSEIQPLQVTRNCIQTLPQSEENIFELLEQRAKEGSFDMDSTCLKEFMTRRIAEKLNESDDNITVQEQLKNKRLEPVVLSKTSRESSCCSSDELEEEESQHTEDVDSTESEDSTHKTVETTNHSSPQQTSQVRVRFSDSNETHEYEEESDTNFNDNSRLSAGNNPQDQGNIGNNDLFTQFKQALFSVLQNKADQHLGNDLTLKSVSDTTLTPKDSVSNSHNHEDCDLIYSPACKELQEKTEVIKIRLAELEKEIQNFKDNNVMLMKAKQEHELHKTINAQEHFEAMEEIKDEKIRMEIYLHDERVKLEDEKRQLEQNIKQKTQGLVSKERKENERLKQQINQLETQLKAKESNHSAAQARLRSQIRSLEREQSKLHGQIENLTKDVKRLENENLKISREQNNKILMEINRNIAKLAPKQIQNSSTSTSEEGPHTLCVTRSVSKCIVAAATANKSVAKGNKPTSIAVKPAKNKKLLLQKYQERERSPETSFVEKKPQLHQKHYQNQQQTNYQINCEEDEEDDDVFREFQVAPEKINDIPTVTEINDNDSSPTQRLPKGQNHVPVPPPSLVRISGGYCNSTTREILNDDGSKDIWYPNGNLKKISADGMIIRMLYYNKDIKETNINEGTVKYYYAETNTWHTTYLDGLEILEYPNGQVEHRHKNGVVEVHYPNNSIKIINPKDEQKKEEWRFPDGTHLIQLNNGDKILSMSNGQKEIHNKLHKRREYPDGTVKIIYPDGSAETRYSSGRVRLKDKEGKLVMDTDISKKYD